LATNRSADSAPHREDRNTRGTTKAARDKHRSEKSRERWKNNRRERGEDLQKVENPQRHNTWREEDKIRSAERYRYANGKLTRDEYDSNEYAWNFSVIGRITRKLPFRAIHRR
jgi:hypothetical protein